MILPWAGLGRAHLALPTPNPTAWFPAHQCPMGLLRYCTAFRVPPCPQLSAKYTVQPRTAELRRAPCFATTVWRSLAQQHGHIPAYSTRSLPPRAMMAAQEDQSEIDGLKEWEYSQ